MVLPAFPQDLERNKRDASQDHHHERLHTTVRQDAQGWPYPIMDVPETLGEEFRQPFKQLVDQPHQRKLENSDSQHGKISKRSYASVVKLYLAYQNVHCSPLTQPQRTVALKSLYANLLWPAGSDRPILAPQLHKLNSRGVLYKIGGQLCPLKQRVACGLLRSNCPRALRQIGPALSFEGDQVR